jgi:hypothetical protein
MEHSENEKPKLPKAARARKEPPATLRQRDFLAELGVEAPENLTKAEASALISEALDKREREKNLATDAQKRRLRFYQVWFDEETLSKRAASRMIEEYKAENPESEAEYQAWKRKLPDWDEFGEVTPKSSKTLGEGCLQFFGVLGMLAGGWIGNKLDGHWFWGGVIGFFVVVGLSIKFEEI